MATASASAASAVSRTSSRSSCLTMWATCVFSAPPMPTTASLMARGAYSCTPSVCGTAASAAPRAWPSLSALSAFLERNTRSTAISWGECCAINSATRAWISAQAVGQRPPEVAMQPCATMRRLPLSQSMMPKPVRRLPGSSPRMRAEPADDMRARIVAGAASAAGSDKRARLIASGIAPLLP